MIANHPPQNFPKFFGAWGRTGANDLQVNHQLSPVWSPFLTFSLKKQYIQLNSAHNMNNISEVVTLSVIALNWAAPVKNGLLLKWPKNKIYENSIIARGTLSSNINNFWSGMLF